MQKVLVAGAGGFVGARVMQMWQGEFELRSFPSGMLARAEETEITAFVLAQKPQYIVNAAAMSDTRACEDAPELSYRANVLLPLWLAHAANKADAGLVSFSSDQVYFGCGRDGPLPENADLHPANVYGRHKLEAERRVLECLPDAVLLRATWLYDLPGYGLPIRGNLPLNLLRAAASGHSVSFSCRDFRGVTYVRQAIEKLRFALALPGGVYNFGSDNDKNMLDTAQEFADALGLDIKMEIMDFERNLAMDCGKAKANGIAFDTSAEGILRCLRDYGLK